MTYAYLYVQISMVGLEVPETRKVISAIPEDVNIIIYIYI